MKYCYNCDRITPGEPLFCNYCGRSYDVKLCPRLHPNPRRAEVCSRCGSRDFSTPQPERPLWAPPLEFLLSGVSGVFLTLASLAVVLFFFVTVLSNPRMVLPFVLLSAAVGIVWGVWSEIPQMFRSAIYALLKRLRSLGDRGGGE